MHQITKIVDTFIMKRIFRGTNKRMKTTKSITNFFFLNNTNTELANTKIIIRNYASSSDIIFSALGLSIVLSDKHL